MVNYCWTTSEGHRVTEYCPFSLSYAVLHSPCLQNYQPENRSGQYGAVGQWAGKSARSGEQANLVQQLTGQQLKFDYFSADVLRQLLEERVAIRDRNRASIAGALTEVSGQISCASEVRTPDSYRRRQGLEKTKIDLERELRETDERLWKDTAEIRERLITASRTFDGSYLRSGLFSPTQLYNDNHEGQGDSGFSG